MTKVSINTRHLSIVIASGPNLWPELLYVVFGFITPASLPRYRVSKLHKMVFMEIFDKIINAKFLNKNVNI